MKTIEQSNKIIMQSVFIIILICISLVLLFWNYCLIVDNLTLKYNLKDNLLEKLNLKIDSLNNNNEFVFIEQVLNKFAKSHNYSIDYDCKNYSKDLDFILINLGYNSTTKTGFINKSYGHRWVQLTLDIEGQNGKITNLSNEYPKLQYIGE